MRTAGLPYLVGSSGERTALQRVAIQERGISEDELQDLLDQCPGVIPAERFDEAFAPLVSLGREIQGVDNLYIAPNGRLTLVETKLWRNPQATREALAQLLDYAVRFSRMAVDDLEQACRNAPRSTIAAGNTLHSFVAAQCPEEVAEESEFYDGLARSLRKGRFLLLIVGDGIRESLENVLDKLYGQSHLQFSFGLVELQIYDCSEMNRRLIVPQVLAHSTEVVRAVVNVSGELPTGVSVEVPAAGTGGERRLSEQEFIDSLPNPEVRTFAERLFAWGRRHGQIAIASKSRSAAVRLPFSQARNGLILLRLVKTGSVGVTPPRLRLALAKARLPEDVVFEIANRLKQLFPDLEIRPEKNQVLPSVRAEELLPEIDRVLEIYTDAIEQLRTLDPAGAGGDVGFDDADSADADEDEDPDPA